MDTIIRNILSIKTGFVFEILIELFIDIILDHLEAASSVQWITKTGCVNNRHSKFDSFFENVQLFLFNRHSSIQEFLYAGNFTLFVQVPQEETID